MQKNTFSGTVRHNARIIRRNVKGMTKAERYRHYDMLRGGPVALALRVAVEIAGKVR